MDFSIKFFFFFFLHFIVKNLLRIIFNMYGTEEDRSVPEDRFVPEKKCYLQYKYTTDYDDDLIPHCHIYSL